MAGVAAQSIVGVSAASVPIATANAPDLQTPYYFPSQATTYTFTPPVAGRWKFVGWGAGYSDGPSGAYVEITRALTTADSVSISVGRYNTHNTTITVKGTTATAGRASTGTAGTASGGDVNLNGSGQGSAGGTGLAGNGTAGGAGGAGDGGSTAGGSGAPANLPFRGANGADFGQGAGPGAGGAATNIGGPALVLAVYLGP